MEKHHITFFLVALIGLAANAHAQDQASISGVLSVSVRDMKDQPRQGEQILFESAKNGNTYKGISGEDGRFEIELPGDDTYLIKIKSIGDPTDYNRVTLPFISEGERLISELIIRFEPAKQITLDNVYFDTNKATLRSASFKELDELVEWMKLKPALKIEIAGHTDSEGSDDYNLRLSQQRAESVRNYLIKKGIKAERIVAKGYGETKPVASNETEEGRQQNRRTEVIIIE